MRAEALKGHLDALILGVLATGPLHGYAVIEELKQRSGGSLTLPEGTVYPALHRLEARGALNASWQPGSGGPRRRYYTLTDEGRGLLVDARQEWDRFVAEVGSVAGAARVALTEARRV